jgi:hypothetical protein
MPDPQESVNIWNGVSKNNHCMKHSTEINKAKVLRQK